MRDITDIPAQERTIHYGSGEDDHIIQVELAKVGDSISPPGGWEEAYEVESEAGDTYALVVNEGDWFLYTTPERARSGDSEWIFIDASGMNVERLLRHSKGFVKNRVMDRIEENDVSYKGFKAYAEYPGFIKWSHEVLDLFIPATPFHNDRDGINIQIDTGKGNIHATKIEAEPSEVLENYEDMMEDFIDEHFYYTGGDE